MKKIKQIISAFIVVLGLGVVFAPATAMAVNPYPVCTPATQDTAVCKNADDGPGKVLGTVVNVLLFIVGAISVVMIIVGGIQYSASGGDSTAIGKAKNTILFAVIGLVVSFAAYAIIYWVLRIF